MADNHKKAAFRMLLLIATPKLVNKAVGMFKEGNVPTQYVFHAQGTATSEVMDMLGLDGVDKNILMGMMPKAFADEMLKRLRKKLHLGMPNTGIAFTVFMSGGSGHLVQLIDESHTDTHMHKYAWKQIYYSSAFKGGFGMEGLNMGLT